MNINRRDLFKSLLAGAIAVTAGLPFDRELIARHLRYFDVARGLWNHRLDVLIGTNQYACAFISFEKVPTEREMAPAILTLSNHIERAEGVRNQIKIGHQLVQNA